MKRYNVSFLRTLYGCETCFFSPYTFCRNEISDCLAFILALFYNERVVVLLSIG